MKFMQGSAFATEIKNARNRLVENFRSVDYEECAKQFKSTDQYRESRHYMSLMLFSQT